eukprot:COSAG01_NODE_36979_length_510_cov_0.554745_1_plen_38_part_00
MSRLFLSRHIEDGNGWVGVVNVLGLCATEYYFYTAGS